MEGAFLGRGWSFPPRFDVRTRKVQMVSGDDDIRESLKILLTTRPGERVMQPRYGCAIGGMAFELVHPQTIARMEDIIRRAILFYEPRIDLEEVTIKVLDAAGGRILVGLVYTIRTTNSRSNLVFPLYLQQGTTAIAG